MEAACPVSAHSCFRRLVMLFITFCIAITMVCCGGSKTIQKTPKFSYEGTTLSKGVETRGQLDMPTMVTNQFNADDTAVYAHLNLVNITGEHKVRWDWYRPDGKLYYTTGNTRIKASRGNYIPRCTPWHSLTIKGDQAQEMPGEWGLKVFFDNEILESKTFSIIAVKKVVPAPIPVTTTKRIFPDDWGLIIGVEDYAHLPKVDYARKDALVIKEYFNQILGVPEQNIITLIDSDATKARISGYLKRYIPNNVSRQTTLYVYFAGHGAPDMRKGEPYLVPYDGDTLFIEETGYKLKDFYKAIYDLNVNQAYVFLDSCFSGVASRAAEMLTKGARPALIRVEDVGLATQEVISISAAANDQVSNPLPREEHGLFTYYLLKALKGKADDNEDRFVTIKEIYDYVNRQVTRVARRMGKEQTPTISPALEDLKDISVSRVIQ